MTILLSAYFPEGIVFAADKRLSLPWLLPTGHTLNVALLNDPATKVLKWPNATAVVGFAGIAELAGRSMHDWLQSFICRTSLFTDIDNLAHLLRNDLQIAFDQTFSPQHDISQKLLIVHFGGFADRDGVPTPVMYQISNGRGINYKTGRYLEPPVVQRRLQIRDEFKRHVLNHWPRPGQYPIHIRARLRRQARENRYTWFNNGSNYAAFNIFKAHLWQALSTVRQAGIAYDTLPSGLPERIAFCEMAVDMYGAFYTYHYPPPFQYVGGGVNSVHIPWPE